MTKIQPKVFQFKIKLCGIKPMIWRRVLVLSTDTFRDFHHTIQAAMGWEDYHLHQFTIFNPQTASEYCLEDNEDNNWKLGQFFSMDNKKASYVYDFGDDWEHEIVLEKILEKSQGQKYPQCIAGERACPPEDCGGIWGYEHLLKVIKDPNHSDYDDIQNLCDEDFNPEEFNCSQIQFNS